MKFLITGGCGFVGSNVASQLLERGEQVLVWDNLARANSSRNLDWLKTLGAFHFDQLDLRYPQQVSEAMQRHRPDAIFHLAGQVAMTTSMQNPRLDFETNVMGSFNMIEAVRLHCPEATLVYASSNKVYGDLQGVLLAEAAKRYTAPSHPKGIDESATLDFQTPYGCSKGAADQYMLDAARVYNLNTVVFRHSTIYGGRQFATFDQGWVAWFCQQAHALEADASRAPFTIAGNGKQVRDLLYVDDAVNAYLAAAKHITEARGQAFNIGGGLANSSSLLELFDQLSGLTGKPMVYTETPWRHSDQRFFVADNSKASKLLNWQPLTNKTDGVTKMLEWTRAIT